MDAFINKIPELFPSTIGNGYLLKEIRVSKKLNIPTRRIIIDGVSYTIRPSFVMPYHTALSDNVEKALFLRKFDVPFLDLNPEYSPKSVNTDGWKATMNAWTSLFPWIFVICCFLHVFIKVRDRSSKKYKELFDVVGNKIWNCYEAATKASFSQRVRRLYEWTKVIKDVPDVILKPIEKLKKNLSCYSKAYDLPGCHRTSNMVDRLMQRMDRHLFSTFYFHGSLEAAELSIRGWALIQNFAPCNPTTIKKHDGWRCPAEWINKSRYHENWLQNLLSSASMRGFKHSPPNPL